MWHFIFFLLLAVPLYGTDLASSRSWLSKQPLEFIENKGQIVDADGKQSPDVLFKASHNNCDLYFTRTGISYVFKNIISEVTASDILPPEEHLSTVNTFRMDMQLLGANPNVEIIPEKKSEAFTNYYLPHCPNGITHVSQYRKLVYRNIYPKIDLVFYGETKGLKYDFIVRPGGDPNDIRFVYQGAKEISLNDDGGLSITNPLGSVEEHSPVTFQADGRSIPSRFHRHGREISFRTGTYDHLLPLTIDPKLEWSTYYGGAGDESTETIITDPSGNVYVSGFTYSPNFPLLGQNGSYNQGTLKGNSDMFIAKFTDHGVRLWSTYYGGSGSDIGKKVVTDESGNLYVTGGTSSPDFPAQILAGAYNQLHAGGVDAFVLKFDSLGVRQWGTFYGGSRDEEGFSILCVPQSHELYMTGHTNSPDFPTLDEGNGAYFQGTFSGESSSGLGDVFIVKFDAAGVRLRSTYYGGNADEWGNAMVRDKNGNLFVVGSTLSYNFPLLNPGNGAYFQNPGGGYDAFILKFTAEGILRWATCHGGSQNDGGDDIAIDSSLQIYVSADAESTNYPTLHEDGAYNQPVYGGASNDGVILKFDTAGVRKWATYFGGNAFDRIWDITIDHQGKKFLTGYTASSNLPLLKPDSCSFLQSQKSGGDDMLVFEFNEKDSLVWCTYVGGSGNEHGMDITAGPNNEIYLSGYTISPNFPTKDPGGNTYLQSTNAGSKDAVIMKFAPGCENISVCDLLSVSAASTIDPPTGHCCADFTLSNLYQAGIVYSIGAKLLTKSAKVDSARGPWSPQPSTTDSTILWSVSSPGLQYGNRDSLSACFTRAGDSTIQIEFIFYDAAGRALCVDTLTLCGTVGMRYEHSIEQLSDIVLDICYPDPASISTTISFNLKKSEEHVSLVVTDVLGRAVARPINNGTLEQGAHSIILDLSRLKSGIYFYTVRTLHSFQTKVLSVMK